MLKYQFNWALDSEDHGSYHNMQVQDGNQQTCSGRHTCTQWAASTALIDCTVKHTAEKFNQACLCSKPCLQIVVHGNGTEYTDAEFKEMLSSSYNIKAKQTLVKNPTANSLAKVIYSILVDQFVGSHCSQKVDC
jgi:hypothetical protein